MSVRELGESDREMTLRFLGRNPSFNLFIIGDIVRFGFEKNFQQLWGDFDSRGRLRGVLLRYFGSWIPYGERHFDVDGFARIIREHDTFDMLSGTEGVTEAFRTTDLPLDWNRLRRTRFAELGELTPPAGLHSLKGYRVHVMREDDVPKLMELTHQIEEFQTGSEGEKMFRHSLRSGESRGYWVEEGGRAIAMARTAAENPYAAMVIGVGTHPSHRRKGLASALLVRLCKEVLAEGKKLCLFYDNPEAGAIYKRLGFRDIGTWNMIRAKPSPE